jgi:hypothetical protein
MVESGEAGGGPLRWLARILGVVVAILWLTVGIGLAVLEREPWTPEAWVMAGLILASSLAVVVAWRREKIGGLLVVLSGVAHSVFALISSGHNRGLAMLISGGPFLLIGALFALSARGWGTPGRSR